MSIPREYINELRSRTSLAKVAGRKVAWNYQKSNSKTGDMWSPCPFHKEQTSSFHVDDRKGYYYCFGCRAKGDVFSFIRETQSVGFVEAVRILAREAGLPVPEEEQPKKKHSAYITCVCSCGRTVEISAAKLEPKIGPKLTAEKVLPLIPKLRCTQCKSQPSRIYDDQMKQIFGPSEDEL